MKETSREEEIRAAASELLDETVEARYSMSKHHPSESILPFFVERIQKLVTEVEAAAYERGKEDGFKNVEKIWDKKNYNAGFNSALASVEEKVKAATEEKMDESLRQDVLSLINSLKKQS